MDIALLTARVLLAAVFLVAGLAKLVDLVGSRQALRDFGVPAVLARPFGLLLPLAELVVAVVLLPPVTAWWGALGALALLLLFVVGIGFNLARGRTPDCHCFGQLHSAPAGWSTLIRNLVLAAVAGFIVGFGRTAVELNPVAWLGMLAMAQRIELLVAVLVVALLVTEGWLIVQMLSQQGRLLVRIEELEGRLTAAGQEQPMVATVPAAGLPVGTQAPAFSLAGMHGESSTLDSLRARGKLTVLIFSDPDCGPCNALLPEVGHWQREYVGKLSLALISRGTPEANRSKASEHGITQVLLQHDREVATTYQSYGTPGAVLIRSDGTIGSPLAQGADAIRALVGQAIGLPALRAVPATNGNGNGLALAAGNNGNGHAPNPPVVLKMGEAAPAFSLPDLSGQTTSLSDFQGQQTLVLFWNPGCGFCQRMLDELKAWEISPPQAAPTLLVVSTGTVEANEAMGLRSTVVLDTNMSVGRQFGANGTPMAVLLDAEGKVVSEVAAGAPAVLTLARAEQLAAR